MHHRLPGEQDDRAAIVEPWEGSPTPEQNRDLLQAFVSKTVESATACQNSGAIEDRYHRLLSTQT